MIHFILFIKKYSRSTVTFVVTIGTGKPIWFSLKKGERLCSKKGTNLTIDGGMTRKMIYV
ncbi:MAG: hypothetical protein PWQ67_926 [Clostridia bacterium]|jgi:hypothetical protein|nr:hypothetical protein [Clostridia bacterium]MDN5322472.1 hypothetical protein [Clostridia bacterium]